MLPNFWKYGIFHKEIKCLGVNEFVCYQNVFLTNFTYNGNSFWGTWFILKHLNSGLLIFGSVTMLPFKGEVFSAFPCTNSHEPFLRLSYAEFVWKRSFPRLNDLAKRMYCVYYILLIIKEYHCLIKKRIIWFCYNIPSVKRRMKEIYYILHSCKK